MQARISTHRVPRILAAWLATLLAIGLWLPGGSRAVELPVELETEQPAVLITELPIELGTELPVELEIDAEVKAGDELSVYLGTYTRGESRGIYHCRLNIKTGQLSQPELVAEMTNPSFLALHPSRRFLYAVGEVDEFQGSPGGAVSGFAIDEASGRLTPLNSQSSRGGSPCHLIVDRTGRNVLVANYGGGSVAALPLDADGKLRPASAFVQHEGSSVDPRRQQAPHAHSIHVSPDNRFAVAADLGLDKLLVYQFDAERGTLAAHDPPAATVEPGSGPRHFAFHPSGKYAYVINELASTVTAFQYDAPRGSLTALQTISTLPNGYEGNNSTAEVKVSPDGRFLYGSNRGHHSLAVFAIDKESGRLTPVQHQPTGGRTPRNFNLEPGGRFLLAANQDTDNVVVFAVDTQTGKLRPAGHEVRLPVPVCVVFRQP
ncbi:MAG: lactonase family protein [Pirellulaceae bacterium]|nr:lactonase family protein [Pirellulaceae bacterium]